MSFNYRSPNFVAQQCTDENVWSGAHNLLCTYHRERDCCFIIGGTGNQTLDGNNDPQGKQPLSNSQNNMQELMDPKD